MPPAGRLVALVPSGSFPRLHNPSRPMVSSSTSNPRERSASAMRGGGFQGDLVFDVLSAADDQDVVRHAMLLFTRGPMPVTMVWGMVPAQRAQSLDGRGDPVLWTEHGRGRADRNVVSAGVDDDLVHRDTS